MFLVAAQAVILEQTIQFHRARSMRSQLSFLIEVPVRGILVLSKRAKKLTLLRPILLASDVLEE